ncbi:NAD-dependent aldehyde dehydrogenase [Bernardetia litoralis DSM 6794]|uniref:NAD-dependent aldehyde dehydrogenase n=1 Tax=Bernardetia litoralis (strain ATCC 23117 / DSM 6794 / NBRC 15988 / NCIMB 1366 / Fx l1 / Sio-4) TaxID=880071 RepID=I4AN37_BERLS|nr:NAD-dependent succinate-semialdehyde dehydrogenase [Bernardetia litoralis]AFM05372.1 NAD-dependent aldehyde dehydrogenase [Bernardetia litoralis DSM 6794]
MSDNHTVQTINPATNEVLETYQLLSATEITNKIQDSETAFQDWKKTSFSERSALFKKLSLLLKDRKQELAILMTKEMGKPISQAKAEIEKCALLCDFYAEKAASFLSPQNKDFEGSEAYVRYDPLGVILAVMPWNFPFWQVFRFAVPSLMAGNVGILKHSSNSFGCGEAIASLFLEVGFPKNTFQNFLISGKQVKQVLENNHVKAATLTGSEAAGSSVAEIAGKNIKKTVLELGGNDPFIVLADADIQLAAQTAVKARTQNSGQSCIAGKRFIIVNEVYDEFVEEFKAEMSKLKMGNPMEETTDIGCQAREDLAKELDEQVQESIKKGAKLILGGKRNNAFYEPTILVDVKEGMPAFDDELFGPVASVIKAEGENHAIELANNSEFGLGSSVWTKDIQKAKKIASQIESGSVFINGMVKSDPRLPFGGIKKSGYGRELSINGIHEFVNIKTVWIS